MTFDEIALGDVDLRRLLPGIKTQAQHDAAALALRALVGALSYTFEGRSREAEEVQKGLILALGVAEKATRLAAQVEDSPEAVSAKEFVEPPKEFEEEALFNQLMAELPGVVNFQAWYDASKEKRARIVSSKYRNPLYDEIRKHRCL